MFVIKRNGEKEPMRFDKINDRVIELGHSLDVDPALLAKNVISGLVSGMTTEEIDKLTCETAFAISTYSPDYDTLAGKIYVSNMHKITSGSYQTTLYTLQNNKNKQGDPIPLINNEMFAFALKHIGTIEGAVDYSRDYNFSYFGLKTLEKSYLLKNTITEKVIERPQHMFMRVALGIHYPRQTEYIGRDTKELEKDALVRTIDTYNALSLKKISHASPTLFNSGTVFQQFSSCFLFSVGDEMGKIYDCLKNCALTSKFSGGLGVNISNVRCSGSIIRSVNGKSQGIIPMIQVFAKTASYVNQGSKRNGALALYLEPWHGDIMEFLELRLEDGGGEDKRATNIFLALWMCDLFMKRLQSDGIWSLMCPDTVKGLTTTYGEKFEKIYLAAESEGKFVRQLPARDVWTAILKSQQLTGTPYILWKDHINKKSNQKNIGVIQGSNLCAEIVEYTDPDNIAVCNLASLSLPYYAKSTGFDFEELGKMTELLVVNLNRIIDYGFLPTKESQVTNSKQRAIGIGVQGLQEVMYIARAPWDSETAKDINRRIHETISFYATKKSTELAETQGSYHYFNGSPISEGKLQCDLWDVRPITNYDWDGLREKCKKGIRNSLLIALMPTAATAQILGNTESFEAATSNIYSRKVLAGEFPVCNKYLVNDLKELGLWKKDIIDRIIANNGSIQNIEQLPDEIKNLYRTVWEISQKVFVDLSADRSPFIDQTQSLNIYLERPTTSALSSLHLYTWSKGMKTGSYYIRSQPASQAIKFTIKETPKVVCTDDVCTRCSS